MKIDLKKKKAIKPGPCLLAEQQAGRRGAATRMYMSN